MSLHKIWLIAQREYLFNIRRRMFLFTTFILPIISIGLSALTSNFASQQIADPGSYQHIGVVDQTPTHLMSAITLPAPYQLIDTLDNAAAQLKAGTLDLYYALPANYLTTGHIDSYSRASVPLGRDDDFAKYVRQALAGNVADSTIIARLQDPIKNLQFRKPGDLQIYDQSVLFSAFLVPFVFGFILFLAINTTSQYLMSGLAEEKENRMMELFVTSSRPSEMLWGKLLGMGGLGLTQLIVWAALGIVFASAQGTNIGSTLANLQITPPMLIVTLLYFMFGYLTYGAIMAGIGVTANAEQDSRQIAGIVTLIAVAPFILIVALIGNPNGPLPVALSLFPLTAPLTMVMRMAFTPVPLPQIALSLAILIITGIGTVWVSARVFRIGMLSYGKRLGLRELFRALREGRQVITTAMPVEKTGGAA